jgi:threonine dehydrogenase-like Zn-dependent dehydrogenase
MVRHRLPFEEMVTHRFNIEQGQEAFALMDSGECGKVVFQWDG